MNRNTENLMRRLGHFQFHLSTLVLTTLAAGALLYLNVQDYEKIEYPLVPTMFSSVVEKPDKYCCIGWPLYFYKELIDPEFGWKVTWWDLLVCDMAIWITILACFSIVCEWLIRSSSPLKKTFHEH